MSKHVTLQSIVLTILFLTTGAYAQVVDRDLSTLYHIDRVDCRPATPTPTGPLGLAPTSKGQNGITGGNAMHPSATARVEQNGVNVTISTGIGTVIVTENGNHLAVGQYGGVTCPIIPNRPLLNISY